MTECQQTIHDAILTFRICALPGGAKHDDVKKMLSEVLQSKGVPETEVAARITAILAKVDPAECRLVLQSEEAWDKLKGLANKNKVRLITHAELKDISEARIVQRHWKKRHRRQRNQRPRRICNHLTKVSWTSIPSKLIYRIFGAMVHRFQSIPISEFGIDKRGICVMSNQQAEKYATDNIMSVAGLAILAVGYPAIKGHTLLHVPAAKLNGNAIVIPCHIRSTVENNILNLYPK